MIATPDILSTEIVRLMDALQDCKRALFSGYMNERSEHRKGSYTKAFNSADAAIKRARRVHRQASKDQGPITDSVISTT